MPTYFVLVLLLLLLVVIGSFYREMISRPFFQLVMAYAGIVLLDGAIHEMALLRVPGGLLINIIGQTAAQWVKFNGSLSLILLIFPMMLMVQFVLLRRMDFRLAGRIILGLLLVSILVQLYQARIDPSFINPRVAPGKGGLAADMNAFGLIDFLSLGLLLALAVVERSRWARGIYVALVPILVLAAYYCGSRAALGAVCLLLLLLPASYAVANRSWPFRLRLGVAVLPLLFTGGVGLLALKDYGTDWFASWGRVGNRLATTWDAVAQHGVVAAFEHEMRGFLTEVGLALFKMAPWGGWGPGGFYREASNLVYQQSGMRVAQWDSSCNHYLMILCDLGLPMLLINLLLVLTPMACATAALPRAASIRQRWQMAILLMTNLVFLAYILVQWPDLFFGPLWVWTALLAYMLIVAAEHGIEIRLQWLSHAGGKLLLGALVVVVACAAWRVSFGQYGYGARASYAWWSNAYEKNCLPSRFTDEYEVRLCGPDAVVERAYDNAVPKTAVFSVRLQGHHARQAMLSFGQIDAPQQTVRIRTGSWTQIEIPIVHGGLRDRSVFQWSDKVGRFEFHLQGDAGLHGGVEVRLPKGHHYLTRYIVGVQL